VFIALDPALEILHFHFLCVCEDRLLEGYQKSGPLLLAWIVRFKVIAKIGFSADIVFPQLTKKLHFLHSHVATGNYKNVHLAVEGSLSSVLLFELLVEYLLDQPLTEEPDANGHRNLHWLEVSY
jgi:hypothetical protein